MEEKNKTADLDPRESNRNMERKNDYENPKDVRNKKEMTDSNNTLAVPGTGAGGAGVAGNE